MATFTDLFLRTSALAEEEIAQVRHVLAGAQPFSIYFNAALADLERGNDNRWFHLAGESGLVMGIEFDGLSIFTVVGEVGGRVLEIIGNSPRDAELHVPASYAAKLLQLAGRRVQQANKLRYYQLDRSRPFPQVTGGLQRLRKNRLQEVERFYASHYSGAIFSSWMLDLPFWGLYEEGELAAAGGTVVLDRQGRAANIGNFLTAPKFRGRKFAREIAKRLINDLIGDGVNVFTLGSAEENVSAWKAYEATGFQLTETRTELIIRGR